MIPPGSRYQDAEHHFTKAHIYSQWGYPLLQQAENMINLQVRLVTRDTLYLVTTVPDTAPPPQEYFAKDTENMQFLGYKFLDDPKRWHEIAAVNPGVWYPLDLQAGDYLRIPQ